MAESVRCKLEVVAAPTFHVSTPIHVRSGVIGDTVTYTITCSAIGAFTDEVTFELTDAPSGAVVTYDPVDQKAAPGESLTISVDTTSCDAGTYDMTIAEV